MQRLCSFEHWLAPGSVRWDWLRLGRTAPLMNELAKKTLRANMTIIEYANSANISKDADINFSISR
jgi:hypothetical protein